MTMTAEQAIKATDEFKSAVVELNTMENSRGVFSSAEIQQQRERVAVIESSLRTALLHSA
jgi:hypothetical protein